MSITMPTIGCLRWGMTHHIHMPVYRRRAAVVEIITQTIIIRMSVKELPFSAGFGPTGRMPGRSSGFCIARRRMRASTSAGGFLLGKHYETLASYIPHLLVKIKP